MNTEKAAFDRVAGFAEESQRKISTLLEGYIKLTELLGKNPTRYDILKTDVSEIIADTMKKFTS